MKGKSVEFLTSYNRSQNIHIDKAPMLISWEKRKKIHFASKIAWILAGGMLFSSRSIVLSPSLISLFVIILFKLYKS